MKTLVTSSQSKKKIIGWSCFMASFFVIIDQITKMMVVNHFKTPGTSHIEVIPNFFNLVYVLNDGAAWNMFAGKTYILVAISAVVFGVLIYWMETFTEGWKERYVALFLILSGIVGNTIDRIWNNGHVIDFLDFDFGFYRWPSFNVADSVICVGAVIFVISSFMRPEAKKQVKESKK